MAITRLGGATAITGTIPQGNIANASLGAVTALPGAIATGKVLSVNQSLITSTTSTSSSGTYVDTGLSVTITPASSSSKFVLLLNLASVSVASSSTSAMSVMLYRDSTDIAQTTNFLYQIANHDQGYFTLGIQKLDAPNTASQVVYKAQFKNRESNYVRFNSYGDNTSTLTVIEVAS